MKNEYLNKFNKCCKCGYIWRSRGLKLPKSCSKCKQKNWQENGKKKDRKVWLKNERPRRSVFPFYRLMVGEKVIMPWFWKKNGIEMDYKKNAKIMNAVYREQFRYKKKFSTRGTAKGLLVLRIK